MQGFNVGVKLLCQYSCLPEILIEKHSKSSSNYHDQKVVLLSQLRNIQISHLNKSHLMCGVSQASELIVI